MPGPLTTRRQQTPATSGLLHPPFHGISERILDGAIVETIDVDVVEDGGVVNLQLQADGGGDLTCRFAGRDWRLDCTPVCELALTVGTDAAPQINYVYITESAGVLTLTKSTTDWPATPYCAIATVLVQSAASLATDGAYKVHVWTDHFYDVADNGMVSHINKKLRALQATWVSGVSASNLVVADPDAYISTTAGVVYQLHEHTMPAIDMETPAPVFLVNDPTTAYKRITTFDDITQDASTGGINNKYMNLVLWGAVSEDSGDCKLFINLPTATYTVEATAMSDDAQTAVYSFPDAFVGTAFLIARYTVKAKDAGEWSQSQKVDLRGLLPSSAAGGGLDTTHTILDGSLHTDSVTNAVTDGALMYGNATPAWAKHPLVTLNTAGVMSGITQLNVDNLRLDGNIISNTGGSHIDFWPQVGEALRCFSSGAPTANIDAWDIFNYGWAAPMIDTRTSIAFWQAYTTGGVGVGTLAASGRITVGTEQSWTGVAANRDSYMAFQTALDGVVSEKVRINSAGAVGINTTDPGGLTASAMLDIRKNALMGIGLYSFNAVNVNHDARFFAGRARGVDGAPVIVNNGDRLFTFQSFGWDGATFKTGAVIVFAVDGAPGVGSMPTSISLRTGAAAAVERMLIQSDGDILVDSGTSVFVRDPQLGFNSSADGQLDVFADTELNLTSARLELNITNNVQLLSLNGIDIGTGVDVDVDLITVYIATGTPKYWWDESEDAFAMTHRLDLSLVGVQTKYAVDDVADPPTDAQLDTAFGDPTVVGPGFVGILDDAGAGLYCYICFTTGTAGEWFYLAGTKAV